MENDAFLSDILLNGESDHVRGSDDLDIPMSENDQIVHGVEEAEVQVQASGTKKGSRRTKKFDFKEDEVICSGWINVSKDPITGANQNKGSFWKRVHDFFQAHKTTTTVRTESAIMHRWLAIQSKVNLFCACYDSIQGRNQSGTTTNDMVCHMF